MNLRINPCSQLPWLLPARHPKGQRIEALCFLLSPLIQFFAVSFIPTITPDNTSPSLVACAPTVLMTLFGTTPHLLMGLSSYAQNPRGFVRVVDSSMYLTPSFVAFRTQCRPRPCPSKDGTIGGSEERWRPLDDSSVRSQKGRGVCGQSAAKLAYTTFHQGYMPCCLLFVTPTSPESLLVWPHPTPRVHSQ